MQHLKKSFHKLKKNDKFIAIDELIKGLTEIKDSVNNDSNGKKFISYIGFDEDIKETEEIIYELKGECKLTDNYSNKEISEMENNIKSYQKKLKVLNEILNVFSEKEEYYDDDEGWHTTTKKFKVGIKLKDNIELKFSFSYYYHGYDKSEDYYMYFDVYRDDIKLELDNDYYEQDNKYYNGKKINKVKPLKNFQKKLEKHCERKKIDFEKLSEDQVIELLNEIKNDSNKLKEEIDNHEKNKNTSWTFLLNKFFETFEDKDEFESFFDDLD
jgi:hypothetical protein